MGKVVEDDERRIEEEDPCENTVVESAVTLHTFWTTTSNAPNQFLSHHEFIPAEFVLGLCAIVHVSGRVDSKVSRSLATVE
jgi:hypothetical protein